MLYAVNKVIQATKVDKKIKAGKVNYVLLENLGAVYKKKNKVVHVVSDKIVQQAFFEILGE